MENISVELILFSFLILVIVIDFAVKKLKQKPSTQKKEITEFKEGSKDTRLNKKKPLIKISFIILLLIFSSFILFFPNKIENDLKESQSSKKWEEAKKNLAILKKYFFWKENIDELEVKLILDITEFNIRNYEFYNDPDPEVNYWRIPRNNKIISSLDSLKNELDNKDSKILDSMDYNPYEEINYLKGLHYLSILYENDITYELRSRGTKPPEIFPRIKSITAKLKSSINELDKSKYYYHYVKGNFFGDINSIKYYISDEDRGGIKSIVELCKKLDKNNFYNYCIDGCSNPVMSEYEEFLLDLDEKNILPYQDEYLIDMLIAKIYIEKENLDQYSLILFGKRLYDLFIIGKKGSPTKNQIKKLMDIIDMYNTIKLTDDNLSYSIEHFWFRYRLYNDNNQKTKALKVLYELLEAIETVAVNKALDETFFNEMKSNIWEAVFDIKREKRDMAGALEAIDNAIFFEDKLDKQPSGNTGLGTSNQLSALLEKRYIIKWNTLPYGDKNGACEDLKRAADIDIDTYYDFYIKNCN